MTVARQGLWALLAAALVPATAVAQQQGEWLVAPYIWASDVSWDLAQRGSGGVSASDLVDDLDAAGLIRIEYAQNKFGLTFDYVYMSLSDNRRITIPDPIAPIDVDIRAGVALTLFESGAFYRPSGTDSGIDILAGFRYADVDSNLIVTPGNTASQRFDTGDSFTDVFVGARFLHRFDDTWGLLLRGDYGFGGSDGSLNLIAGVDWRSRGAFGMSFAYRHLTFEFDQRVEGEPATSDFEFSGPAIGFMFRF